MQALMAVIDAQFTLPSLPCSFPPKLHPEYERVRAECEPWILGLAPPSRRARQALLDCLLPRYVCRLFPTAPDLARLSTAAKLVAWLTLADDVVDTAATGPGQHMLCCNGRLPGAAPSRHDITASSPTPSWSHSVLSILQRPGDGPTPSIQYIPAPIQYTLNPSPHHPAPSSPLLAALAELWLQHISPQLTPQARSRFVTAMEHHLHAVGLHQSGNAALVRRGPDAEMGVQEYMAIRRQSSGFLVGFELLQYVLGLDEDPARVHPIVEELRDLVLDYMCMCNDVVSCRTEMVAGDYFNLPCIVYNTRGVAGSFQEAVENVATMMGNVDARCVQLVDAIRRDHAELMEREPGLQAYVDTMVSCMSGTLCWSFETVRYGLRNMDN